MKVTVTEHHSSRLGTPVSLIVLHHTGSRTAESAIHWFENPDSKVSAHYVIARDGTITQMVDERRAAWHTGTCRWPGDAGPTRALNRESIGIELQNTGSEDYPPEQKDALRGLLADLRTRYPDAELVRHRDIAWPRGRKADPGNTFPWPFPEASPPTPAPAEPRTLRRGDAGEDVERLQLALAKAGYLHARRIDGDFGQVTEAAVITFQECEGLEPDGVYGPATRQALAAALTSQEKPKP